MRLVGNTGSDRVIDMVRDGLKPGDQVDAMTAPLSLFAFEALMTELGRLSKFRLLLPQAGADLLMLGGEADRGARNQLRARWLAKRCVEWLGAKAEIRRALGPVPQGTIVIRDPDGQPRHVALGSLGFSTDGLGLAAGNPVGCRCPG